MTQPRTGRPGAAALALLWILVITAAWWALALWPAGAVEPEWLARTRAACFGSAPGGLPNAGGWILLIGEPLGMLAVLGIVWGNGLRDDLRRIRRHTGLRMMSLAIVALVVAGSIATVRRVAFLTGIGAGEASAPPGVLSDGQSDLSGIALSDQHGQRIAIGGSPAGPALLTFAFGHCATVCPTIVQAVRRGREEAGLRELPIVIITLDPWRDTPARLPSLAIGWGLDSGDRVLSGSIPEVQSALDAIGIVRTRDETTGDIDHVAAILLLDARGRVLRRIDGGWGGLPELLATLSRP